MKNSKNFSSVRIKYLSPNCLFWAVFACLGLFVALSPVSALAQQLPGFSYDVDDLFQSNDDEEEEASSFAPPGVPGGGILTPTPQAPVAGGPPGVSVLTQRTLDAIQEETRRQAFDAALEGLMPLRPEEIRTLLERFDRTQESVELPIYPAPRPQIAVETLSLDPGMKPKTVRVSHGYVTTFTVVDSTGSPWPIEDITWAGDFEIVEAGGDTNHFIRITPRSEYAYGNMSMRLIGLQTPIILSLETARDVVHYRFDAIVPQVGPFAQTPIIDAGVSITAGDHELVKVLEGGLPLGAEKLSVSGADTRTSAYNLNGTTYLRTPLTLLSPSWIRSTSSSDGMRVYALAEAPVVLLSDQGRMIRVRLSNRGEF